MDIEPLITRSSNAIVDAVIKIYKRKILNKPLQIICDAGKEFEVNLNYTVKKMTYL